MTCKTPVIASVRPKCLMHLSNASGLLTSSEIGQMNKLDETTFDSILNRPPQQPPKHLNQLAQAYKQILNKMIQHEQNHQQQHSVVEEQPEKQIPALLEEDNTSPIGSEDVFEPPELSGLVHIKQEILENVQNSNEETSSLLFDKNLNNDTEDEHSKKETLKESEPQNASNKLNLPTLTTTLEKSNLESSNNSDDDSNSSDSSSSSSSSSTSNSASSASSSNSNSSDTDTSSSNESESESDSDSESSTSSSSDTEIKPMSSLSKSTIDMDEKKSLDLETIIETDEKNSSPSSHAENVSSQSDEISKINDEKSNDKKSG